jgi:DNA (cytosine-5)-methyltransferase 1
VENVAALLGRGIGTVLGDLASLGLDAEWHCIPAYYVGADQQRDRVWILAYPTGCQKGSALAHYCGSEIGVGRSLEASQAGGRTGLRGWKDRVAEPAMGRVVDGFPGAVDQLAALGNAVVPQIPELIGRAILASLEDAA